MRIRIAQTVLAFWSTYALVGAGCDLAEEKMQEPSAALVEEVIAHLGENEPVYCTIQKNLHETFENIGAAQELEPRRNLVPDEQFRAFFFQQLTPEAIRGKVAAEYPDLFTDDQLLEILREPPNRPIPMTAEQKCKVEAFAAGLLAGVLMDESFQQRLTEEIHRALERQGKSIEDLITIELPEREPPPRTYIECRNNRLFLLSGEWDEEGGVMLSHEDFMAWSRSLNEDEPDTEPPTATTNAYLRLLERLNGHSDTLFFLVRDDSFTIFKRARAVAWCRKIPVEYDLFDLDAWIAVNSNGVPEVYVGKENPVPDRTITLADLKEPIFTNKQKEPMYIDVNPDHIKLYPGEHTVEAEDLDRADTPLAALMESVAADRENQYIILVLRPGSAALARRLRPMIESREIDVGVELFETDKTIHFKRR